jgi:5-oxoprolinase (ATP-hydrolysing)
LETRKLLSDNPEQYEDAAVAGVRDLLGLAANASLPANAVNVIKMGTTVATNALLERVGARTVLLITAGLADLPYIGEQNRPRLFDLHICRPNILPERVVGISGRLDAEGGIITPLDESAVQTVLQAAFDNGIRSVAIAFMHSYLNPVHEKRAATIAKEIGYTQISIGHETSQLIKIVPRADTAALDAYLTPLLRHYVDGVGRMLGASCGGRLLFMRSNGGLVAANLFQGRDAILSGPAGGVVGMARTAVAGGYDNVIGFDMGGTSTDVCHYAGEFERSSDSEISGLRLRTPMMRIHTVAAGGGSILRYEDGRCQVGPQSAGANPGPACYRRGGPLTVTDCNVMLGRIQPTHFPRVFGKNGDKLLDAAVVKKQFIALAQTVAEESGNSPLSPEETAVGFLRIAIENMANAIKKISVQRGYDITSYVLNSFGGAGGQHACQVADALGMKTVFTHPFAGVLSAYGMGLADIRALRERQFECLVDAVVEADAALADMVEGAVAEVIGQGVAEAGIDIVKRVRLRYEGSHQTLTVPFGTAEKMRVDFSATHKVRYGFVADERALVMEALEVEVIGRNTLPPENVCESVTTLPIPTDTVRAYIDGEWRQTPLYRRGDLLSGQSLEGLAIISEETATTVVEDGWQAHVNSYGHLILQRIRMRAKENIAGGCPDPVMLEVFNNLFMSIAEQMGWTLADTAYSVNIKERLDFSCALFDAGGGLVANAPHVPVHLGSMGESVRTVIRQCGDTMQPGDSFMLNSPFDGGTHLPDITVVSPIFDDTGVHIRFFVGSRGHHADIGGRTPGSAPPDSRHIQEEGVLIRCFKMVSGGKLREKAIRALLAVGPYPCRNIAQNIADLQAQLAANETGIRETQKMLAQFGWEVVRAYMTHVQDNAEESVRRVIKNLNGGTYVYPLDSGAKILVRVDIDRAARTACIDFSGTSLQNSGNYNVPSAVCRAAVLYVLRTLAGADIPLNEGCLNPVSIITPAGSMLNPDYPAAVIAGNTEVSQAIANCLLAAVGAQANSQGTMNNFAWGDETLQNYETIGGGTGAGPDFDGASAVQSHMTNTRMTDPEVLERRFPVRLEEMSIRTGSGGCGKYKGGCGTVRRLRFLRPMTVTVLTSHRRTPPLGMVGGGNGMTGENSVCKADGTMVYLRGNDECQMEAGDVFVMKTPGGGGWGKTSNAD